MTKIIGVAGGGAMGSGIAQISAQSGYSVIVFDTNETILQRAKNNCQQSLQKLEEKGKIETGNAKIVGERMVFTSDIQTLKTVDIFIEAIPEDLAMKQNLFKEIQQIVSPNTVLASNTSSLSIAAISSAVEHPERVIGSTGPSTIEISSHWINSLGKTLVIAKDTPGFIVNRLARPYYGEALKIVEEQMAQFADVDFAMREMGFKMGPFELMDFIGHDVNYRVTETVWTQMFFDPRYKPSLIQKRLFEWLLPLQ